MTKKPLEPMRFIRACLLVAAGLLALFLIPVPSAQTPHARMPLNDAINRISAQIADEGLRGIAVGNQAKTQVEGARLAAKIYEKGSDQPRVEKLTFEFDNIFALGIRILAFATAFIVIYLWQSAGWLRVLVAVSGGLIMLPGLIFLRDLLFGMLLTQTTAAVITGWFDNPLRILILLLTLLTPLIICGYKGKKQEGK